MVCKLSVKMILSSKVVSFYKHGWILNWFSALGAGKGSFGISRGI